MKVRDSATLVEVGGTVSYNVLPDFRSPVGDDLSLISATTTTDDSVTFQPNGMITFRDTGSAGCGQEDRRLHDLRRHQSQTRASLIVDVKPEGSTKPTPAPVRGRGVVGETVTVLPVAQRAVRVTGTGEGDRRATAGAAEWTPVATAHAESARTRR